MPIQPLIVKQMIKDFKIGDYDYSYVKPLSHFAGELAKTKLFNNKKLSSQATRACTWEYKKLKNEN